MTGSRGKDLVAFEPLQFEVRVEQLSFVRHERSAVIGVFPNGPKKLGLAKRPKGTKNSDLVGLYRLACFGLANLDIRKAERDFFRF
jgi:hypothetical protein